MTAPVAISDVVLGSAVFGSSAVLFVALGIAFVVLVAFLLVLFVPRGDPAASRTLRRGVTMVQRGPEQRRSQAGFATTGLSQAAVGLVERTPKPTGYDDRLQTQIDRAGWQLRSSEFIAIRIAGLILGGALLWGLSGSWMLGAMGVVVGFALPGLLLSAARSRRQKRFLEQLPDTLQLLAGTLKAGYGILQAIDTVVQEVEDPMSSEFQRALTEARLGLPLDESLDAMADRVGSEDFKWVVVAMNIQRQVGGNLAELLETVAATLRGRDQVRRQIQVLSAEGRLSAVILFALPFVLLGWLLVTNPGYLEPLLTNVIGWFMIGGVGVLMVAGGIWIRNLIQIEV